MMRKRIKNIIKGSHIFSNFIRQYPPYYKKFRKLLQESDTWTPSQTKVNVDEIFFKMLSRATRSKYAHNLNSTTEISSWPLVTKSILRDRGNEMRSRNAFWSIPSASGGTTGIPIQVALSIGAVTLEQAVIDHYCHHLGVNWDRSRIAVFRGDSSEHALNDHNLLWKTQQNGNLVSFFSNKLNSKTISDVCAKLAELNPDIIWVYPSVLRQLCKLSHEKELAISTKLIFSSSEVLDTELREQACKQFGAEIIDFYGQAERACAAISTELGRFFFITVYGKVELNYSHSDNDCDLYEIVGSSFWNTAFALVRLQTGDLAKLPKNSTRSEVSEICYGIRPFLGIAGRKDDHLIAPDGRILVGIDHIQKENNGVLQIQIVQERLDMVKIFVLPKNNYTQAHRTQLLENARAKIPLSMSVEVIEVDELEKTRLGKIPFVIRRVG